MGDTISGEKLLWKNKWKFPQIISLADLKQHVLPGLGNGEFRKAFLGAMTFDRFAEFADRPVVVIDGLILEPRFLPCA